MISFPLLMLLVSYSELEPTHVPELPVVPMRVRITIIGDLDQPPKEQQVCHSESYGHRCF
ncbi:unnamed protein product [Cylicocyclus nassatus]|uniref:Uncharacterized protein n=1 Tax=Cylicocyclus nassatus TaxID=53992 RepID=A0AA36HF19_CYLNA|nr:unnamed protein product [Cylicocyclus nassatus]